MVLTHRFDVFFRISKEIRKKNSKNKNNKESFISLNVVLVFKLFRPNIVALPKTKPPLLSNSRLIRAEFGFQCFNM